MMKDLIKSISKYFVQIKESGRLVKALSYSTILTMIIMCLDLTNKPSELIENIPRQMCITLIIGVSILILLFTVNKRLLQSFKMVTSNYIDSISIISLITSTVCTTIWALAEKAPYKIRLGLIIIIFSIVSLLIRLFIVCRAYIRLDNTNAIYDLKLIYNNDFTVKEGMPILISEKDVDYDLLERKIIINQLYKYISNYKADTSYVIGLIGDWGSGKTTILNNVKRELKNNKQVVLIDDFDPWIYGTQEALLTDMFDKIMNETGISFNLSNSRRFVDTLKAITTNTASDLKFVDKVVDKLITTDKEDALNSIIYSSPIETHKEKIEVLQLKIGEISLDAIYNVMVSLWNNLDSIDNTNQFLNLTPKERAMIIISIFLNKINEDELNQFVLSIKNDFGRIADLRHIIYWLNSSKHSASDTVKDKFEKLYSELCSRTIDEKVDLYSDKYYRQYNITGGLFAFYDKSEDKDLILSNYIKNVYKAEYVYKAIADLLSTSVGSHGYAYGLQDNCFYMIYTDEATIKESIEKNPPKNESEKILFEIFEKYQNKENDVYDRYGINSSVPVIFKL